MFERVAPRVTTVDACAKAMRVAILRGDLRVGERLPAERVLAERFGVNRVTVRSALAKLSSSRLLSVRQGSGYVVRDFRREGGPDLLPGLAELAGTNGHLSRLARDLLLMRRHMARAVLERVAEEAGDTDEVRTAVDRFEEVVTRGASMAEIAEADVAILSAVLDATRSPVLGLCLNPIADVVTQMPELRDAMYRNPQENIAGWRLLVGWMETRRRDLIDTVIAELERRDEETVRLLGRGPEKQSSNER